MATDPIITFHDGKFDVPEELQENLKLHEGERFRVISSRDRLTFERESEPTPRATASLEAWNSLRGILKGADFDLNADLEQERVRELELEERMWHGSSER